MWRTCMDLWGAATCRGRSSESTSIVQYEFIGLIACGWAATASMAAGGQPFCVTIDAEGEARDLGGQILMGGRAVLKGQVVRCGDHRRRRWGDPLQRELASFGPESCATWSKDGFARQR